MSDGRLRVLIVDDHPIFRKGLRALLASHPELTLAGEAISGGEAVQLAADLGPDLILMDLQMPGGDGISAIRQIVAARPESRILVVTMFDDDESVFAALRAGARGYVLKDMDDTELSRALLADGVIIISILVIIMFLVFQRSFVQGLTGGRAEGVALGEPV
jgi:DNA-binding NarL/FixJ family response regulator